MSETNLPQPQPLFPALACPVESLEGDEQEDGYSLGESKRRLRLAKARVKAVCRAFGICADDAMSDAFEGWVRSQAEKIGRP